jgi:hypothetical protein
MGVRESLQSALQTSVVSALTTLERLQTGVSFNPLRPDFRVNLYSYYRAIQERDPVHRSRLAGGWLLTRYADCSAILTDHRFQVDERKLPDYDRYRRRLVKAGVAEEGEEEQRTMLRLDPPDHTRLRSLVSKAFTPRAVESLRPRVEAVVQELLDEAERRGEMDVIRDLAYPLPVIVIAELLGIPADDREQLKRWSDEVVLAISGMQTMDELRRSAAAGREMNAYIERIAEERRREPREDLLSALLAAEEAGDKLTLEELFSTILLLLVAGHETTTNLIGNGLLALLRHPAQLALLRDDPALIERAVEELLRYDSPVQATSRFATEPYQIDGHTIKPFQQVALLLGAANRDPAQFTDPDRLDITRDEGPPLSFGNGIHFCLGAPLARIEGQSALGAFVQRFPNVRLATENVEWGDGFILRGLKSLPVTL